MRLGGLGQDVRCGAQTVWDPTIANAIANTNPTAQQGTSFNIAYKALDTNHVKAKLLVENGGTVMHGSIYETSEQEDEYNVPFFGDIPVLGYLLKNRRTAQAKQESLVLITPKMLDQSAVAH